MSAKKYVNKALSGALNGKDAFSKDAKNADIRSGASSFNTRMHKYLRPAMGGDNRLGGSNEFKAVEKEYKNLAFAGKHKEAVEFVKNASTRLGVDFKLLKEALNESWVSKEVEDKATGDKGIVTGFDYTTGKARVNFESTEGIVTKTVHVQQLALLNDNRGIQEMKSKKTFSQLMERIDHVAPQDIAGITYRRDLNLHDHPVAPESQFTGGLPDDHMVANVVDHMIDRETQAHLEQRYGSDWRLMATDIVTHLAKLQPNRRPDVHESVAMEMGGIVLNETYPAYHPGLAYSVYKAHRKSGASHEAALDAAKPLAEDTTGHRWEATKQNFAQRYNSNINESQALPVGPWPVYHSVRESGGSHEHAVAAIRPLMPMGFRDTGLENSFKTQYENSKAINGEFKVKGA